MLYDMFKAGKLGKADDLYTLQAGKHLSGNKTPRERELTGVPPLRLRSAGSPLIDWRIRGAAGGVGSHGLNYLNQSEIPTGRISNCYNGGYITYPYVFGPSIPGGQGKTAVDYNQWTMADPGYTENYAATDARPAAYANCQWFASLPAGRYKLIIEGFNKELGEYYVTFYNSVLNEGPLLKLIAENGTVIVDLPDAMADFVQPGAYYHKEVIFTVNSNTNVGLFTKIYSSLMSMRYMIVDASVEAQPFTNRDYYIQFSGVTCWEPYKLSLPVTVRSGSNSAVVYIDLNGSPLGENDTASLTDSGINIPTFSGINTIDADSPVRPSEMYIKYTV